MELGHNPPGGGGRSHGKKNQVIIGELDFGFTRRISVPKSVCLCRQDSELVLVGRRDFSIQKWLGRSKNGRRGVEDGVSWLGISC